jgi:hypothetical protein
MKYDREWAMYETRCKQQDGEFQIAAKAQRLWYMPPYIAPVDNAPLRPVDKPVDNLVDNVSEQIIEEPPPAPPPKPKPVLFDKNRIPLSRGQIVVKTVSMVSGIPVKFITGPHRQRHLMPARRAAVWLLVKEVRLSYPATGRVLGNRDHSTIIHAVRKCGEAEHALIAQAKALLEEAGHLAKWAAWDAVVEG